KLMKKILFIFGVLIAGFIFTNSINAAISIPGDCPTDLSTGNCQCVPQLPIEGGCTTGSEGGRCSDECGTFAGRSCEENVDCTAESQCSLPKRCAVICTSLGDWVAASGHCPNVGQTCCEEDTSDDPSPNPPSPGGGVTGGIEDPLQGKTFQELINTVINFIFWVAVAIAPLMILIAGFTLVTAGGDPNKLTTAKNIIMWTAVGLAVVLLAKGLIAVLQHTLLGAE
ncbi:MAG: pilin, partial [Patescibacteria group bacterium]